MAIRQSPTRLAIRDSIIAQAMGVVLTVLIQGGLISLLIISLIGQDSTFEIGLAIFVMQLGMLARFVASAHVDVTRRKRFLVKWITVASFISCLLLTVPYIGTYWSSSMGVWVLIAVLALYSMTLYAGAAAWFPLLFSILPPSIRGRYFGAMRRTWKSSSFLVIIAAGALLGKDPEPTRFLLILVPAVLLQFGRVFFYMRLPDPPPARESAGESIWQNICRPLRDSQFRFYMTFVILILAAEYAALPFIVPYLKLSLRFPSSMTMYAAAGMGLGAILSLVGWGRLADDLGNRFVFLVSLAVTAAAFVVFAITPGYDKRQAVSFLMAFSGLVLAGVGTAGIGIAYTVRLMHLAPKEHLGPYMNIIQGTMGVVTGVIALIAGLALARLPETVHLIGREVSTFRLLFAAAPAGLILVTPMLRRLPRLREPRWREIAQRLVPFDR